MSQRPYTRLSLAEWRVKHGAAPWPGNDPMALFSTADWNPDRPDFYNTRTGLGQVGKPSGGAAPLSQFAKAFGAFRRGGGLSGLNLGGRTDGRGPLVPSNADGNGGLNSRGETAEEEFDRLTEGTIDGIQPGLEEQRNGTDRGGQRIADGDKLRVGDVAQFSLDIDLRFKPDAMRDGESFAAFAERHITLSRIQDAMNAKFQERGMSTRVRALTREVVKFSILKPWGEVGIFGGVDAGDYRFRVAISVRVTHNVLITLPTLLAVAAVIILTTGSIVWIGSTVNAASSRSLGPSPVGPPSWSQVRYTSEVLRTIGGTTMARANPVASDRGVTNSPRPATSAVPPTKANGTSEPRSTASVRTSSKVTENRRAAR